MKNIDGVIVDWFTITSGDANDPPQITSPPVATATQELLYSYDLDATDPNINGTMTFSLDVFPAAMTIDEGTGLVQWTPDNSQVGANYFTVRVQDPGNLFATRSFVVTAANANDPLRASGPSLTT